LDDPCAWLSLDAEDGELEVFLSYLLAAIGSVVPGACPETRTLIRSPNPVPVPVLGGSLVNELDAVDTPLVLVLDDYHRIEPESNVHELLWFLLEHPPPSLRLVLVTRCDPPFPIGSLRGRGRLTELRVQDLRFTTSETSQYLERSSGARVSEEVLSNLERQTEGWIVALRLVSLHFRQVEDPKTALNRLRGGTQHIREYLLQEVLDRLPTRTRDCMLKTAVLDRFCPELCEALDTSRDRPGESELDGRQFLEELSAGNLFLIPLDTEGRWFRYHHLFQEMLRGQLDTQASPGEIAALHARASEWFEAEGLITDSIEHALASGDPDHAAEIADRYRMGELDEDRWHVVGRWLDLLPENCRTRRPGLLLSEAWILYERFRLQGIPAILDRIVSLHGDGSADQTTMGELNFFRGALLYWEGRGKESRRCIEEAEDRLPRKRGLVGGLVGLYVGMADCMSGHPERAIRTLNARVQEAGSPAGIYNSRLIAGLCFVRHLSGDLVGAEGEAQRLQVVARQSGITYTEAWASYMHACARLHLHDLAGAVDHFAAALRHRYILHGRAAVDALAGLALSQQLQGRTEAAADTVGLLQEFALQLDVRFLPVVEACRARVSLLRGDVTEAVAWARSFAEPPVVSELFVWLEVPWITRARLLIADGADDTLTEALDLLAAIRRRSEDCRFTNQTIEVAVLQSIALEKRGRSGEARETLQEALTLAGPGGWIRPFVEAGPPMADMIGMLPSEQTDSVLVEKILSATGGAGAGQPRAKRSPVNLLTDREQEILGLLARRLQYKEIAARLFISPQTVNSHLKNVYQKLHVNNRRQAVARASEIGLLPPD
jgi:LuxR family maltose regulon positive regulatory protein